MAMQPRLKSKRDRISQLRRLTDNMPYQAAGAPASAPKSAVRSRQVKPDWSTANLGVVDPTLSTGSDDQTQTVKMFKVGDRTHITVTGDLETMMHDFRTNDRDFLDGLLEQVANASPKPSNYLEEIGLDAWGVKQFADEVGVKSMLAFIKENKPKDPIEATLLAHMAATDAAAMSFANRLANAKTLAERDSAERTFNKLTRTFAVQVEALQRYRSRSENKVIFQHVSVSDSAQAIVGDVTQPAFKRATKKQARARPLIADARQEPMQMIGDQPRARVPLRENER